jgi:hypothetical protein
VIAYGPIGSATPHSAFLTHANGHDATGLPADIAGDTLMDIARSFNVSHMTIARLEKGT